MMTTEQKQLIKATVPTLKAHGLLLTTHFYQRLFAHNPEFKNVFNQGKQQNSHQPAALAMAVLAYAENIDDPSVLLPTLKGIGHKHTSLDVRPEHYVLIGRHLIASIRKVLGEAATPSLLDAWIAAYGQLSSVMIGIEAGLYADQVDKPGGWTGWRPFAIRSRTDKPDGTTLLHLYPVDGGSVADAKQGQYLSIRLFVPQLGLCQPRQYRPVNVPNGAYYAIAVKPEKDDETSPNGLIGKRLSDGIQPGDLLDVSAPAGTCPVMARTAKSAPLKTSGCPMHEMA